MFDPKLAIGDVLKNADIVEIFKCGNMGGMRRSKNTNTLVIVSDYTKGLYHDKWIGGVLHYTGMGKTGDQDIHWAQNVTLAESATNGVDVHLFEVIDAGEYIYCGRIELVDKPYTEVQPGDDGVDRKVWMFPIRPVPDNNVKKPPMFVFSDMDDFKARGKNVDKEYARLLEERKKRRGKTPPPQPAPVAPKVEPTPIVEVPAYIIGKQVMHKTFGTGVVTEIGAGTLTINFDTAGTKKLLYDICMKSKMLEIM